MRRPDRTGHVASDRPARALAIGLCCACLLFLGWKLWNGLDFISFMDESTHVVGGRVLDSGGLLYRDFVDSHGPLIFAMAQGYGALFGWSDIEGVRMLVAACAVLAMLSLACSSLACTAQTRACGLIVGGGLLATVWLRQGLFLFSFYPVGGALASIGLSGFVAGACFGRLPRWPHAVVSGAAIALLAGTAYSFLPCIAAFVLAGCWTAWASRETHALLGFLAGLAAGGVLVALWMLRFADLHGYLSYHLAENQLVYSHYIGFGWPVFRHGLIPSALPGDRARTLGLLCLLLSLAGMALRGTQRVPLLLVVLGVMSLNARGAPDFQNGSFLWAAITLLALVAMRVFEHTASRLSAPGCLLLVLLAAGFMRGALYHPFEMSAQVIASLPRWPIGNRSDAPLFAAVRRYARPDEPILGLLYQPQLYLLADRLPMDGFYAWFPWDQAYVRMARFGRGRDLCSALADHPPPVMVVDPSSLWDHAPSEVVPCLAATLSEHYVLDPKISDVHGQLYVRRDRVGSGS